MAIEHQTVATQPPGVFRVWYERYWDFGTLAGADAFAHILLQKKIAEYAAYKWAGEATIFVYCPPAKDAPA